MTLTDNDKDDFRRESLAELTNVAAKLVVATKKRQGFTEQIIYVNEEGNDEIVNVYGYFTIRWKSTDSMDGLAAKYLGDASKGSLLAYFNRIANEHEIEAGTKIKIPKFEETAESEQNRILAIPEQHDLYGVDIALNENNEMSATNGDLALVSGADNLNQSITMRIGTKLGKRIRYTVYGIKSEIGDPVAISSYLMSSIAQTLDQEPRIGSVNEIGFKGEGDKLKILINYTDINQEIGNYQGEI